MKKILLPIALLIGGLTFGQNVQDQKVSFKYIQLPTNPIPKDISNYNLVVDILGCQNFGMDGVFFNPEKTEHNKNPRFEISCLSELKTIF